MPCWRRTGLTAPALAPRARQEVEQSAVRVHGRQAQVVLDRDTLFLSAFSAG
ncbi:hypothetical protein [Streptomyces sp. Ru62]|uniref:hypothetical protein n=1 Tax=Streptomyces sp. Ru62 TaxID=2080745 RepID=UPI0015E2A478|nr:hypothetical protein [Streptomyces sp. Ru62]